MTNTLKKSPILLCLIALSLSSCGTVALQDDVKRLQSGINDLRSFQAEQTTKITSLETEMHQLSGRIEELEFAQNKKLGSDLTDLKKDLTDLRRRVPPPSIVPAMALEVDESRLSNMPTELSDPFKAAFEDLRGGQFADAESRLKEVLDLSHGTEWVADAMFWIGVARDGQGNSKEALQAYLSVVNDFPKNKKAAAALLRQAAVFVKLGDHKTAKLTLNKLISNFPKSEEALRAKERLKDLS